MGNEHEVEEDPADRLPATAVLRSSRKVTALEDDACLRIEPIASRQEAGDESEAISFAPPLARIELSRPQRLPR